MWDENHLCGAQRFNDVEMKWGEYENFYLVFCNILRLSFINRNGTAGCARH